MEPKDEQRKSVAGRRPTAILRLMDISRRCVVGAATIAPFIGGRAGKHADMYGLIGKFTAQPGQRDALTRILLDGTDQMPGCLSYIVAHDPADPDTIWITEAWDSKDSHAGSLTLPAVRDAIARAMPLIAGMTSIAEIQPVGGHGLGHGLTDGAVSP